MSEAPNKAERIDDAIADVLLELLTKGRKVVDVDGNVSYVPAAAADITAAIKYVSRKGVSNVPVDKKPAGNLVNHMNRHNKMFPGRMDALAAPIEDMDMRIGKVG